MLQGEARRSPVVGTVERVPVLRLEAITARHTAFVDRLARDPLVRRFTRVPEPMPDDFASSWVERYVVGRREGIREGFVVIEDEDLLVGLAFAPRIDRETATAELGYVVAPEARGRGVAGATLGELSRWAFADLGMERCELLISVENASSARVAERCGYVLEGVLRRMWIKPGLREDTQLWSRLVDDSPPRETSG